MSIFVNPICSNTFTRRPILQDTESRDFSQSPSADGLVHLHQEEDNGEDDEIFDEDENDDGGEDIYVDTAGKSARPVNPNAGKHRSLRYQHIDVLVTLLHKSILDSDWSRAEQCYGLLLRCKNVDIRLCYELGLDILNHTDLTGTRSAEFLTRLINAYPPIKPRHNKRRFDRADVFVRELAKLRISHSQYRVAMQELDAWLLIPPYKDDKTLWQYLAQCCEELGKAARRNKDRQEIKILEHKRDCALAKVRGDDLLSSDEE